MSDTSPSLALPYLQPAQAQKHVTVNEALSRLDLLAQMTVAAIGTETPPATPMPGEAHVTGSGPSGAWAGHADEIARWSGAAWEFFAPRPGWRIYDLESGSLRIRNGASWTLPDADRDNLDGLGIGTSADATNRLAVAAPASLFSHEGAGHQVKINKAGTGETASLLFQSGWTGHAEIGLAGSDGLSVKVSPDGGSWTEAVSIDPATGRLSGAAVQSDASDATMGRLMTVGAFGLGAIIPPTLSDIDTDPFTNRRGWWRILGTTTGSLPPGGSSKGGGLTFGYDADDWANLYADHQRNKFWVRMCEGGAIGGWDQIYTQRSALGEVSQSAGVPTGALIQSGSSGSGHYRRFACGFMECWHSMAAAAGAAAVWSFPSAFVAAPVVTGSAEATVLASLVLDAAPSATAASFSVRDKTDARRADIVHLRATGRWFG